MQRVALLGPYASRNLGDTAIQLSAIQNLRARRDNIQIVGISPDPEDTLRSLGIGSFPLSQQGPASGIAAHEEGQSSAGRRFVPKLPMGLLRAGAFVRTLDLLLISGGGQIDDFWGGGFGHPWALLKWTLLARLHRVPVAFLAVGFDRLDSTSGRLFALSALRLATYRSFRDFASRERLQALGLRSACSLCPDLAFGLQGAVASPAGTRPVPPNGYAVINPVSPKTWSHAPDPDYEEYVQQLSIGGVWLDQQGVELRIVCSQPTMDSGTADDLARALKARGVREVPVVEVASVEDYLAQVANARVVIASRLHGALLSLFAGTPVVALAPLPKLQQLMIDVGLPRMSLPLKGCAARPLVSTIEEALVNNEGLRSHIRAVASQFRSEVAKAFDEVVLLLESTESRGAVQGRRRGTQF